MEMFEPPQVKVIQFLTKAKQYLRDPAEPDRLFAKGKKIEVVYVVVSKSLPLFRTEGVGDVTEFTITTKEGTVVVPAIMPEKIQAKLRRRVLEILREHGVQASTLVKYKQLNYKKFATDQQGNVTGWNCHIAPPTSEGGTDVGMCGYCPACNIFGTIITDVELEDANTSYGIKSRVVHDPAFAVVRREKAEAELTHNKVGDGLSYTGIALFGEVHGLPGVAFVGKLVLNDVTMEETRLVLSALSSISRMGGGETKYGSVQVIIVGLKAGNRETVSSYDIARHIIEQRRGDLISPEEVVRLVADYIRNKGFTVVIDLSKPISDLDTYIEVKKEDVAKLWEQDNYEFAKQVTEYVKRVQGGVGKKGRGGREESEGEEEEKEEKKRKERKRAPQ